MREFNYLPAVGGYVKFIERFGSGIEIMQEFAFIMTRDHMPPFHTPAEEEVENQTDYRECEESHAPCYGADWISVLGYYHNDASYHEKEKDPEYDWWKPIGIEDEEQRIHRRAIEVIRRDIMMELYPILSVLQPHDKYGMRVKRLWSQYVTNM